MNELINHLLNTYSTKCLAEMTGIESWAWEVEKRTPLFGINFNQYKQVKQGYINYLTDRLKEVNDIDTNEIIKF